MARDEAAEVRRDLAARPDVEPEILYFLAEDPSPEVRRQIAANKATPVQADLLLAKDDDQDVRGGLAEKIAQLAPGLTADEQDKMRQMAYDALEILARDQAIRVRQILSEALKDIAGAPPEVIRQLASDVEVVVSGPVLQYSPVLTEDDLLEIIGNNPSTGNLSAIAQREEVPATLADVIVATYDEEAVALLLNNSSAQIREEMLDRIIDRAPDIEPWHEPLVHRPVLPGRAAAKLARFVAHNLLEALKNRQDLEPDILQEVRDVVDRRLEEESLEIPEEEKTTALEALETVKRMHAEGGLDEDAVAGMLKSGDREMTIAALAALSGLKVEAVRSVLSNRSAKGMVSVAWKAGLSVKLAEDLQKNLALISPSELLRADGASYPLDEESMEWQLDFIKDLG
ncbi:MAG: DUF2336 domain-containing protein [Rhodospirillales bacterium]|nr:DUF2336 domain-containing protein [Alphaproteobacteria bacterium]MBL6948671.1 DUF2336 domain-containing protein [Rhodospirillales bacterium]